MIELTKEEEDRVIKWIIRDRAADVLTAASKVYKMPDNSEALLNLEKAIEYFKLALFHRSDYRSAKKDETHDDGLGLGGLGAAASYRIERRKIE